MWTFQDSGLMNDFYFPVVYFSLCIFQTPWSCDAFTQIRNLTCLQRGQGIASFVTLSPRRGWNSVSPPDPPPLLLLTSQVDFPRLFKNSFWEGGWDEVPWELLRRPPGRLAVNHAWNTYTEALVASELCTSHQAEVWLPLKPSADPWTQGS